MSEPEAKRTRVEDMAEHSSSQNAVGHISAGKFEDVLKDKSVFVDKTLFIWHILEDASNRIMLTAPSRFGKTVNITTLRSFFARGPKHQVLPNLRKDTVAAAKELQEKYELFKDFKIYQCDHDKDNVTCPAESSGDFKDCEVKRKFYMHCGQHPVIFLNFGTVRGDTLQNFLDGMQQVLSKAFRDHFYLIKYCEQTRGYTWSDKSMFTKGMQIRHFLNYWEEERISSMWEGADVGKKLTYIEKGFESLYFLLSTFYNTEETGKKIILLIDEQDAPIIKALFDQSKDLEEITRNIRELMYLLLKSDISEEYLFKAVTTSMSAIGGILSVAANNLLIRPFLDPDDPYYECFGFNQTEVKMIVAKNFAPTEHKEALENIKLWYNNYVVEGKNQETYCPLSVKLYVSSKKLTNYWCKSVGGQLLDQAFQHEEVCKQILPHLELTEESIDIDITLIDVSVKNIQNLRDLFSPQSFEVVTEPHVHLFLRFLVECGFFNIIKRRRDTGGGSERWTVQIPNIEVGTQLSSQMQNAIQIKARTKLKAQKIAAFQNALLNLTIDDNETYIALAEALEDLYSDDYQPISHFCFQSDLFFILSHKEHTFFVRAEFPVGKKGVQPRIDLLVICNEKGIILELKRGERETAVGALKQILNKEYWKGLKAFEGKFKATILIGLHLDNGKKVTMRYLENPNYQMKTDELLKISKHVIL